MTHDWFSLSLRKLISIRARDPHPFDCRGSGSQKVHTAAAAGVPPILAHDFLRASLETPGRTHQTLPRPNESRLFCHSFHAVTRQLCMNASHLTKLMMVFTLSQWAEQPFFAALTRPIRFYHDQWTPANLQEAAAMAERKFAIFGHSDRWGKITGQCLVIKSCQKPSKKVPPFHVINWCVAPRSVAKLAKLRHLRCRHLSKK